MAARYAIYHCPETDSGLYRVASDWLGYDAASRMERGAELPGEISEEEWRAATETPRTYGFHATLKPPFRLADGRSEQELLGALSDFARTVPPADVGPLSVSEIGGFIALLPACDGAAVGELAAACVESFDGFRAAPEPAELDIRRTEGLSPRQAAYLERWGYPYVLEEFRFHMTLTGRLDIKDRPRFEAALDTRLSALASTPQTVGSLCLFVQPSREARFQLRERFVLEG